MIRMFVTCIWLYLWDMTAGGRTSRPGSSGAPSARRTGSTPPRVLREVMGGREDTHIYVDPDVLFGNGEKSKHLPFTSHTTRCVGRGGASGERVAGQYHYVSMLKGSTLNRWWQILSGIPFTIRDCIPRESDPASSQIPTDLDLSVEIGCTCWSASLAATGLGCLRGHGGGSRPRAGVVPIHGAGLGRAAFLASGLRSLLARAVAARTKVARVSDRRGCENASRPAGPQAPPEVEMPRPPGPEAESLRGARGAQRGPEGRQAATEVRVGKILHCDFGRSKCAGQP